MTLVGLTVAEAVKRLDREGLRCRILRCAPPKGFPYTEGEERVVRQRANGGTVELAVSLFQVWEETREGR